MSDPVSWLVVERGWRVVAADGSHVGQVEDIVADEERDIFSGVRVATSLLGASKWVPAERVAGLVEGEVRLDLSPEQVDQLGEHGPGGAGS